MKGNIHDQSLLLEGYEKKIALLNKNIVLFKKILIIVAVAMLVIFLASA